MSDLRCAVCRKPYTSPIPNGMTPLCSWQCRDRHFVALGCRPPVRLADRRPGPAAPARLSERLRVA